MASPRATPPAVQECVLVFVVLTLAITLAADVTYAFLNPRVRVGEKE